MLPIARSPYARDVALWVAGGDQTAFTPALAAHENASWTGGYTGGVDQSLATFDHQECWIARRLALQGHNVIALPRRQVSGLRSPDAAVGGLLVEFKTYTGLDPRHLLCRVGHARPQADRVVVGAEAAWDPGDGAECVPCCHQFGPPARNAGGDVHRRRLPVRMGGLERERVPHAVRQHDTPWWTLR